MAAISSQAGPSTPRIGQSKKIVDYASDADTETGYSGAATRRDPTPGSSSPKRAITGNGSPHLGAAGTPTKKRKELVDGVIVSPRKKLVNGHQGDAVRSAGSGQAAGVEARRREAERLFKWREALPFYQGRRAILEEILSHDTTIIIGETGCGKSTQLPHLLRRHALSLSHFGRPPRIVVTQPRRLPAIALAQRVSAEMGVKVGEEVGYTVRFEDATSARTGVRYCTEGVLMRELASSGSSRGSGSASASGTDRSKGKEAAREDATGIEHENTQVPDGEDGLDLLLRYDVVVVDEAHERTLNTDFLCGALKKIQRIRKRLAEELSGSSVVNGDAGLENGLGPKPRMADGDAAPNGYESPNGTVETNGLVNGDRKGKRRQTDLHPLKIVVMSATLDPSKFTRFFETGRNALIVKGRMYPVETRHVLEPVDDFIESAARQVLAIHCASGDNKRAEGDVLVFMPGSDEIENCAEVMRRAAKDLPEGHPQLLVLPLYASLPPTAQAKIFAVPPKNTRRVIIATNIAETSLTIPGVSFVVDTGFKKEKEYIFRTSGAIEHLKKKHISKAAAWQRTGRAGREREGQCFRLYTQQAFDELQEYDAPEIQRCNLAAAVLQLVAMGQDPFEFEYVDSPGKDPILAAFQTLAGLGALSGPTKITPLGRSMLSYPLDPSHARILIASFEAACPAEIIDILALTVAGPVWIDRANDRENIAAARAKFIHRDGDHLTGMNVFRAYLALKEERGAGGAANGAAGGGGSGPGGGARWCKENFVNSKTLAQAVRVREQLRELTTREGRDPAVSCGSKFERVGRCLLQGLFINSAVITPEGGYRQTAGSLQVKIHPSSVLMSKKVPAILYDELTITSSIYARNVSAFEQQWLTEIPWIRQAGQAVPERAIGGKI